MPSQRHVAAGQRMLETARISPLRHQSIVATGPTRSRRAIGAVPRRASRFLRVRFDTPGVSQPRRASSKSYAKLSGLPRICLFSSGLCLFQACSYKAGREAVGGGRVVAGRWPDPAAGPRGLRTSRDAPRICPTPPHTQGTLPLQPRGLGQSPAAPFGEVLGSPSARRQALLTHSLAANELLLFLKEGIWD